MEKPLMYRKRYVPNEIKSLNDDEILYMSDDMIVTKWKTFKPKKEFSNGISCTFMNRGYKISKFMDDNNNLVYYYHYYIMFLLIPSEFPQNDLHTF